jgi:hypothetical protein
VQSLADTAGTAPLLCFFHLSGPLLTAGLATRARAHTHNYTHDQQTWQGVLIASVGNFQVGAHGSVAVYIDDTLAARLVEWPQTVMIPQVMCLFPAIQLSV